MNLYRITPQQFLENYDGLGASFKSGARWNAKNHPVLYFALSPSVALLEMANYLPSPRLIPKTYRLGTYQLSEQASITRYQPDELPTNWADYPHPIETVHIGTEWLKSQTTLCLQVPSAAVSEGMEDILVVNAKLIDPSKPQIKLIRSTEKLFNQRMFDGLLP